jgi:hypothetical protein
MAMPRGAGRAGLISIWAIPSATDNRSRIFAFAVRET